MHPYKRSNDVFEIIGNSGNSESFGDSSDRRPCDPAGSFRLGCLGRFNELA